MADELKAALTEWIAIKKNLKNASADIKVIRAREKQLAELIKSKMITSSYDVANVDGSKVQMNKKVRKIVSFSKANVIEALNTYFSGDQVKIEAVIHCISDLAKEREVVTLTLKNG
jgi:hypothetical protein